MAISLTLLHKRIDGHQKQADHQPYAKDLNSPLHRLIREVVALPLAEVRNPALPSSPPKPEHIPAKYNTPDLHEISRDDINALSNYFQCKLHDPNTHSAFEVQMEHRTWEHIHAVVRYAYSGDKRKAKLHANIASTACKEFAHFMDEPTYVVFVSRIEHYLEEVKIDRII